jgi:hypothetical protein
MPFIAEDRRNQLKAREACKKPGEVCYLAYKEMMKLWHTKGSWTTAHDIYYHVKHDPLFFFGSKELEQAAINHQQADIVCAVELAWQVFFNIHVMEYEHKKKEENGDVL